MLEAKEMKRKIKHVESFKQENQVKISYDLWQLSNDDRKRLAENMWGKFWIYKEKKKGFSFNVKYQKHGLVTILDQFIKEGKLPSLNLNSRCRFGIYQSLYGVEIVREITAPQSVDTASAVEHYQRNHQRKSD